LAAQDSFTVLEQYRTLIYNRKEAVQHPRRLQLREFEAWFRGDHNVEEP